MQHNAVLLHDCLERAWRREDDSIICMYTAMRVDCVKIEASLRHGSVHSLSPIRLVYGDCSRAFEVSGIGVYG